MLEFVFIALFQAAAGPVEPAPEAPSAEQSSTQTAPDAAESGETNRSDPDRVTCRREPVVGTRLSRRICTTARQDAQAEEDARNLVNRVQGTKPLNAN